MVRWLAIKVAAGSRLWAWVYDRMRIAMIGMVIKEAKKAAAAKEAAVAAESTTGGVAPAAA